MFKDIPLAPLSLSPPMTARLLCECQKQRQAKQFQVENQKRAKVKDFHLYFCRLTYANELAAPCTAALRHLLGMSMELYVERERE